MVDYPLAIFLGLIALGAIGWLIGGFYKPKKNKKEKQTEGDTLLDDQQNSPDVYVCDMDSVKNQALYEVATEKFKINLMGIVTLHEMTRIADQKSIKATTWDVIDTGCRD